MVEEIFGKEHRFTLDFLTPKSVCRKKKSEGARFGTVVFFRNFYEK